TDVNGKKYIDGISSLWVNVFGHRRKEIDDAIKSQIDKISHSTMLGQSSVPVIELAEELTTILPEKLSRYFFSDDGSTACEVALKICYQFHRQKKNPESHKKIFVKFSGGYHGDTIGSVSVGGIELFHNIYSQLLFDTITVHYPYCYRCPYHKRQDTCGIYCLSRAQDIIFRNCKNIAGLIVEPLVQGAAGMIMMPEGFLSGIRDITKKCDIPMIADEVATGFGRTGKLFACQHENVVPDIMVLAKGITGGYLPFAVTAVNETIYDAFLSIYEGNKTFFHGHTYTGNQLASIAARETIRLIKKENIIEKMESKVAFLENLLKKFYELTHVGDVRQKGFMIGIELVKDKKGKIPYPRGARVAVKVILKAREKGLILRPLGDVIVLMPPLVSSEDELKKILETTYVSIKEMTE
ncbi:MAG: adenosylmethionine--8-amino-7-oxononanoate transaminase, partial [Candidatus Auribacterota bacterium]|nr:adenosylmethionine--8-amino-7-oxononanoate transaminase [Candidatus Auribacterota bacterium]